MEVNHIIKNNIAPYVDGIIYVGIHTRNVKGVADNCEKPVVYCYCYAGENSPCAMIEQEKMSYSIIRHFYELGHRNISIIAGRVDSGVTFARLAGCKKAFDELQFPVENYHIVFGDWEVEKGYTLAKKLLTVKNPPTAIFAMNDKMASGVLKACRELNIHVPDDLSVVGFDNRSFSAYCTPALSTVDLSLNELGKESVLLLMDYINNPQTPPKQIIIDGKYLERETVARAHD